MFYVKHNIYFKIYIYIYIQFGLLLVSSLINKLNITFYIFIRVMNLHFFKIIFEQFWRGHRHTQWIHLKEQGC